MKFAPLHFLLQIVQSGVVTADVRPGFTVLTVNQPNYHLEYRDANECFEVKEITLVVSPDSNRHDRMNIEGTMDGVYAHGVNTNKLTSHHFLIYTLTAL